ncbi:hypothetical protein K435DRAFT_587853, partial [Dendrothele bispora CBS 962.96]
FPPQPSSDSFFHQIITDWTNDCDFSQIKEVGCAVCGQLKPMVEMNELRKMKNYLHILEQQGLTCNERKSNSEAITKIQGPVIDQDCNHICDTCRKNLREGKIPRISLANGFWLGAVPRELKELNFMERLLVQKMRTNCCFVKVSSGMRKMISHVIAFETPVTKVYD